MARNSDISSQAEQTADTGLARCTLPEITDTVPANSLSERVVDIRRKLKLLSDDLDAQTSVSLGSHHEAGHTTEVYVTKRLQKKASKEGEWASARLSATLRNVKHGYREDYQRSSGKKDGVFLLDRTYRPRNAMQQKIFDRFLDKPDPLVKALVEQFDTPAENFMAVRIVSHHLRLLGVMIRKPDHDHIVVVDLDRNTRG